MPKVGKFGVESIELEEITVGLTGGRTGAAVADAAEVVETLAGAVVEQRVFGRVGRQDGRFGWDVPDEPMGPGAGGRVGVVRDEGEGLGVGRGAGPGEVGGDVVVVAPDKFKGSLTATEAADAIGRGLRAAGADVDLAPVADGGEGTLDALVMAKGGNLHASVPTEACLADTRSGDARPGDLVPADGPTLPA